MLHVKQVFIICIISTLKLETLQKELGISYGADTERNEAEKKWNSIFNDFENTDLSKRASTDDPNKLNVLFSIENDSDKRLKSSPRLSKDQMYELAEDEVFVAEAKDKHKRSIIEMPGVIPNLQTNSEASINFSDKKDFEFSSKLQHVDNDDFNADTCNKNAKSQVQAESCLKSGSPLLASVAPQETNIVQQSDIENFNPRSFIFNPNAEPQEEFQNCTTPKNESGTCKYLQHCLIPTIVGSLNQFMEYVCIIEGRFIGVCCPHHPVAVVVVQDQEGQSKEDSELNENCGVSTNTRIVGGSDADPKAWPWMVALFSKSRRRFFCGGALINDRYVLTAAHCTFGVVNNEIIARVGEYDFKDDGGTHEEYVVVEMKRHGHYNRRTLRNDIALLKLEKPVVFNEFVKTICFPEEEKDYVGEKATLAGWGNLAGGGATSDVLQQASLPVISNEECSKGHELPIPESLICTGSESGDKGACNGDSGGPLMLLDKNNRWKVIGLVSWGRRGCNPEFPTVYTRVSYFLDWIKKHAR